MICEIAEYGQKRTGRSGGQDGERKVWHGSNVVNLCVDTYDGERQCGNLYHLYTREPISFSSLLQAVMRMNDLYEELQFPQASTEFRSFSGNRKAGRPAVRKDAGAPEQRRKELAEVERFDRMIGHRGTCATFLIRVQYRQHSSWQGEVIWVDRQRTENFRSALELIRLLDSALSMEEKRNRE